jgi:hypothetical protein
VRAGLSKWGSGTLEKGVDIVVGTPGRVEQLINEKKCDVSQIRFYVLDEVDGLISQGHGKMLEDLYQKFPKATGDGDRLQVRPLSLCRWARLLRFLVPTHVPSCAELNVLSAASVEC